MPEPAKFSTFSASYLPIHFLKEHAGVAELGPVWKTGIRLEILVN
jgi:hypothetical protein